MSTNSIYNEHLSCSFAFFSSILIKIFKLLNSNLIIGKTKITDSKAYIIFQIVFLKSNSLGIIFQLRLVCLIEHFFYY